MDSHGRNKSEREFRHPSEYFIYKFVFDIGSYLKLNCKFWKNITSKVIDERVSQPITLLIWRANSPFVCRSAQCDKLTVPLKGMAVMTKNVINQNSKFAFADFYSSIASASVPSAALVLMLIVLSAIDAPYQDVSLLWAIDWFV